MPNFPRVFTTLLAASGVLLAGIPTATSASAPAPAVSGASHHDTSGPLAGNPPTATATKNYPAKHDNRKPQGGRQDSAGRDTSSNNASPRIPSTNSNFGGIGANGSAPPDSDGAVGATQYVSLVNSQLAVYSKAGVVLLAAENTNTLWSGFGGDCETHNDGDGTIHWDPLASRWFIQQFTIDTTNNRYNDCLAVSTTTDATGSWNRYAFAFANFPDYPKTGVWPDAYYASFNLFNQAGTVGLGSELCAFDRTAMLNGLAATMQCFMATTSGEHTVIPASVDGSTPPPAGSPEWFVGLSPSSGNALGYYQFHVDWTTPANSSLSPVAQLPVAAFNLPCTNGGTCIPQARTTQQLDSLGDRVMFRLAYRNYGDHQALVINHSISAGSAVGVRWYELRPSGNNLSLFQQGTYAPDSNYRWMGSIAMDHTGDMAMGYSVSSSSLRPGIRYTGRLVGDPAGAMPQGEATIITGAGSQSGSSLSRWGDYTEMTVDPSDDCTFWYVNQYEPATGAFNWATRIASFKFPSCTATVNNDFSISANPSSASTAPGQSVTSTITTAVTSGAAQSVALVASGLPTGATATFNPTQVTAGGSSTMTIATSNSTPVGTSNVVVTGTGASATHTTTVTLTVNGTVTNDFSISASPAALTVTQGQSATSTISTAVTSGSAESISLTATGAQAAFNPAAINAGASSTMTVTTSASTPVGTSSITVTGSAPSNSHSTTVNLTVYPPGGGPVVTNGGFETASFSGWTPGGASQTVVSGGHSGAYSARLGSTSATNGDSTIQQTITVPANGGTLSFWYQPHCSDSLTYDQEQAQLRNTSGATLLTLLNVCSNSGTWTQASVDLASFKSTNVVLWFNNHDDNYAGDPTYTLIDDVSVGPAAPPPPAGIANGGFETGNLTGWTGGGAAQSVVSGGHSGTYSARVGSTTATNGDSSLAQTFTAPTGTSSLTLWFQVHCPDSLTYDWETVVLRDNTTNTSAVLNKTCTNTGGWQQLSSRVTAGHGYTLTLTNHDDNYTGDPTYTLFDDIALR